jgi:mRNA interferase YafQ
MLEPIYRKKFQKDLQLAKKRGKDLSKLSPIISNLINQNPLDKKLLDHPLKGNYSDCRECHIEPDWLLIYLPTKTSITFVRTGTHSDLFK